MKHFLEMIKIAQRDKFNHRLNKAIDLGEYESFNSLDRFMRLSKKCHVFVQQKVKMDDFDGTIDLDDKGFEDIQIDAPFEVFSIESIGAFSTAYVDPSENLPYGAIYDTECIMVCEIEPKKYIAYVLANVIPVLEDYTPWVERAVKSVSCTVIGGEHSWDTECMIKDFLKRLAVKKTGVEKVGLKKKYGTGKERHTIKINKVIHVSSNQAEGSTPCNKGGKINWSHAWSVRGHWRKCNGRGKDRAGEYVVDGYTWVKSHVKGNDQGGLVKKIRIVD